jgi:addiction module HigA family antidote
MARTPIHPGEHLADDLQALGMSASAFAAKIDVPVNRITAILNGTRAIPADTALRLAHFFGTSPQFWINLQGLKSDCLEPLGLAVTAGAKVLGVTRQALNNVVNGKAGISAEMAIRLAKAFGSTADTWLRLQANYELAQALKSENKIRVRRYRVAAVHA